MANPAQVISDKITAIEIRLADIVNRISNLETKVTDLRTYTDNEVEDVAKRLDKLDEARSKLTWMVIMAVGAAFVKFVLDGKLGSYIG